MTERFGTAPALLSQHAFPKEIGEPTLGLVLRLGLVASRLVVGRPELLWREVGIRIKIGARIVTHGRYVTFQMAEVAVPSGLFEEILRLIAELRAPPAPA